MPPAGTGMPDGRGYNQRMLSPVLKILRTAGHLLAGALTVLLLFPHLDRPERARRVTRWAGQYLHILGVRVRVVGRPPSVRGSGALLAANHVSWIDIHLLHSQLPARFVSKAEVRGWPLIGWLAEAAGTVFLVREKKADAMRVNQIMAEHLRLGDCLALFPEGTTSDGSDLLPFYPSLFQPAVEAGAQVWPVRIRYLTPDGDACDAAAYHGDMSLWESFLRIVRLRGLEAELSFLPPIESRGLARRELAKLTEAAIREAHAEPDSAPGSTVRLPA
jgi:1-acyl-sn-glycerol-3-phosphate acyltransferase